MVVPFEESGVARAALLTQPLGCALVVNGYRPLGVAVLEERDEIIAHGEVLYFGERSRTSQMRFEESDESVGCARCKQPLCSDDLVIRCPACGAFHHAGAIASSEEERLCWTYDARCGACERPRDEMLWAPEEREDD